MIKQVKPETISEAENQVTPSFYQSIVKMPLQGIIKHRDMPTSLYRYEKTIVTKLTLQAGTPYYVKISSPHGLKTVPFYFTDTSYFFIENPAGSPPEYFDVYIDNESIYYEISQVLGGEVDIEIKTHLFQIKGR